MNKELIPERLRNARENLGISMAEASRRLNLSKIDYIIGDTDDMSPDTIVITRDSSPEMYEFVRSLSSADTSTQKRLIAYFNKIYRS